MDRCGFFAIVAATIIRTFVFERIPFQHHQWKNIARKRFSFRGEQIQLWPTHSEYTDRNAFRSSYHAGYQYEVLC